MASNELYQNIFRKITAAGNILLVTHENPDGDALASVCAMAEMLKEAKKIFYLFCADKPGPEFNFLPQIEKFTDAIDDIIWEKLDLVIVLDCGSLRRTAIADKISNGRADIINIDHHVSNDNFGRYNIVDPDAVSTTQLLHEFFKSQKVAISRRIASCILTGIITDSGNFAYTATNSQTFSVASEMLMQGASVRNILNSTFKNKKLTTLQLWGYALNRLQQSAAHDIIYTILTAEDLNKFQADKKDLEGLASFLNSLKDAKIILILYELGDGRVKGSLRTNRNDIDVSRLAAVFGGGGHRKAAGFEVEGKLVPLNNGWKVE